jgi:hypothetical protein
LLQKKNQQQKKNITQTLHVKKKQGGEVEGLKKRLFFGMSLIAKNAGKSTATLAGDVSAPFLSVRTMTAVILSSATVDSVGKYLFGDKYLFSVLPNQQRARSDFSFDFVRGQLWSCGKVQHAEVKEICSCAFLGRLP